MYWSNHRRQHRFSNWSSKQTFSSDFSAKVTEAYVFLQGVLFASEMQISCTIFESNALSVIQALSADCTGGEIGHILHDIKSTLHSFSCYSFKHLKTMELILYRTDQYGWNLPCRNLGRYRKSTISFQLKYRLYRSCSGHTRVYSGFRPII